MDQPKTQPAKTEPSVVITEALTAATRTNQPSQFGVGSSAAFSSHSQHTHGCGCPKLPNGQGGFYGR